MLHLLSEAGRSFLRAFAGSLLILLPGVLAAPNFDLTKGLALSALIASIAAGLKAIQVFVPQLSLAAYIPVPFGLWVDSFVRAFLATFITGAAGLLGAWDPSNTKAAIVALLVAAVTAGLRALQGLGTQGESPAPQKGLTTPAPVHKTS